MRFDDNRRRSPRLFRLGAGGLRATWIRTTTTGAGKKKEQLKMVVDRMAYIIEENWLATGWQLWWKHDFPRDYFLCMPTVGLQGARPVEARYADGVAMSRALMGGLSNRQGDSLLLTPRGGDFWTEHSDRVFVTSV